MIMSFTKVTSQETLTKVNQNTPNKILTVECQFKKRIDFMNDIILFI